MSITCYRKSFQPLLKSGTIVRDYCAKAYEIQFQLGGCIDDECQFKTAMLQNQHLETTRDRATATVERQ